jgi:putative transposase
MDFIRDSLFQVKPFRIFNVIDVFNREGLNTTIAQSITCERVIMELEQLISWRGRPQCLRVDNGPEFIAHALEEWCKEEQIELWHIQNVSPSQNAYVERFNRTFREVILDPNTFIKAGQAQARANDWMWTYNNFRPHESLNNLPPTTFMMKYGKLHSHPLGQTEFPAF